MRLMGRKGAREVRGVEHRRVVRGLQAVAEDDVRQEEFERPLILLIAAGSAECDPRLAIAERESRAERGARPFAAFNAVGVIGIEVEHLRPRPQTEAQAVDDRRALQPASAWRARDQVSTAISDRDMNRVAAHSPARLGPGAGPVAFGDNLRRALRNQRLFAVERSRPEL